VSEDKPVENNEKPTPASPPKSEPENSEVDASTTAIATPQPSSSQDQTKSDQPALNNTVNTNAAKPSGENSGAPDTEKPKTTKSTLDKPKQQKNKANPPKTKISPDNTLVARANSSNGLVIFALLMLVTLTVAGGYVVHELWGTVQTLNHKLSTVSSDTAKQSKAINTVLQDKASAASQLEQLKLGTEKQLRMQQSQINGFAEQLNAIKGSTRRDWLLAEAEYILRIANQRLLIENDPIASESLLEAADKVLAEIADPALMPVRIKIAEELLALRSAPTGQVDKLLLRLTAISNNIPELGSTIYSNLDTPPSPQGAAIEPVPDAAEEQNAFQRFIGKVSKAASQAITIHRLDEPLSVPPTPEYGAYLQHNMALRLEQAKLLLMRNQFERFAASIQDTLDWSKATLPSAHPAINAINQELASIAQDRPSNNTVDITGSLNALRTLIEQKYRDHSLTKLSPPQTEPPHTALPQSSPNQTASDQSKASTVEQGGAQ